MAPRDDPAPADDEDDGGDAHGDPDAPDARPVRAVPAGRVAERLLDVAVGEIREAERQPELEREEDRPMQRDVDPRPGQLQDRPMPEVEAVAAHSQPAHPRVAERPANRSGRMGEGG